MKALCVEEIDNLVEDFRALVGSRLQKIYSGQNDLVFEFYGKRREGWLWLDLHPQRPFIGLLRAKPKALPKIKKPIALFLRAHATDRHLFKVERSLEKGRVIVFTFGSSANSEACVLELRLFPHGQNVGVSFDNKSIWWSKPRDLPLLNSSLSSEADQELSKVASFKVRTYLEMMEEWRNERGDIFGSSHLVTEASRSGSSDEGEIETRRLKLVKVLEKINAEMAKKKEEPWFEVGEWLKTHQKLEVPERWQQYIDPSQSLAENISRCFLKAKSNDGKLLGTQKRYNQIQQELSQLETKNWKKPERDLPKERQKEAKSNIKFRKYELGGKWTACVGRSAQDNLALLRQAKAWDLWLHLKDFPSSFCIIHRNKGEAIDDEFLREAALWMAQETFGTKSRAKSRLSQGEKLAVVAVECRHVRPIRGDKLGRVTYKNAHHFGVIFAKE